MLLYTNIHLSDDCLKLQHDLTTYLTTFEQWEADWKMSFNLQKYENHQPNISSKKLNINEVMYAKYLGVTIDKNLGLNILNKSRQQCQMLFTMQCKQVFPLHQK